MSRFFRSGDSTSSSSEDEDQDEIESSKDPATTAARHQLEAVQNESASHNTALSLTTGNHANEKSISQPSPQWTSHHKDVLLHALLEHWSLSETVQPRENSQDARDSIEVQQEAQAKYSRLVSQLAPLNVLPADLAHKRYAQTRRDYRDILSMLGRQTGTVGVGAGRVLTDGSGDGALSVYHACADPARQLPRDQHVVQSPLQRLLGHVPQQDDITMRDLGVGVFGNGLVSQHNMALGSPQSRYRSDFEEISILGRGGYGIVYHARNRLDDQAYAVKKIPLSAARLHRVRTRGQSEVDEILMELRTLARLHHPNIVRYHNAWVEWTDANASSAHGLETTQSAVLGAEDIRAERIRRVFTEDEIDGNEIVFEHSGADALPSDERGEAIRLDDSTEESSGQSCDAQRRTSNLATISDEAYESYRLAVPNEDEGGQLRRTRTRSTIATASDETVESIERETEVSVSILSTANGAQFSQPALAIHIQMSLHPMTLADLLAGDDGGERRLRHCYHLQPSVELTNAVLDGLEYLHEERVVHRDIKPANIFLSPSKNRGPMRDCVSLGKCSDCVHNSPMPVTELEVCIGDFGLAAVASAETDEHSVSAPVGTAIYRPPHTTEAQSSNLDIYALGIVFFELLWKFTTRMERHHTIHDLKEGRYPDGFCEWIGRGRGVKAMDCIDYMLSQHDVKAVILTALRSKLEDLVQ